MDEGDELKRLNPNVRSGGCYRQHSPLPQPQQPRDACEISTLNRKLQTLLLQALVMVCFSPFFLAVGIAAISRRRRCHRQTTTTSTTPRSSNSFQQDLLGGTDGFGLSPRDLQMKLPSFNYREEVESGLSTRDCAVCLEVFSEGDCCRMLPNCKHVLHANCVDSWLNRVPACPICRSVVGLKVEVGLRYGGRFNWTGSGDVKRVDNP